MYQMSEMELFKCFCVEIKLKNNKVFLWKYLPRKLPKLIRPKLKKSVRQLRRFYERYGSLEISPFCHNNM